jgi:hypothetical protein
MVAGTLPSGGIECNIRCDGAGQRDASGASPVI